MAFEGASTAKKTDNNPGALAAKIDIRRRVLSAMASPVSVFDAFAGKGELYSSVWKEAAGYTGCDLKYMRDGRLMFCGDNRRVLRAIDLTAFNLFDLDAYSWPWEQAMIIAARRRLLPGELIGLVLTEAGGISYKANSVPLAVTQLAGVKNGTPGLGRLRQQMFDRCVAGVLKLMRAKLLHRWQAMATTTGTGLSKRTTGMLPIYCGLVLRGNNG